MEDKQNYFTYTDNTSDSNDKTMENLHKQIMIDGVDVSECISLDRYYIANCTEEFIDCALGGLYEYQDEYKRTCKENPNCYYKQFKRKEQQCEAIKAEKAEILFRTGEIETLQGYTVEDIRRIEQELQEAMDCYVQLDLQRIKENKDLIDKYNNKEQEVEQYKQTLDEIKEIATHCMKQDICTICDYSDKCHIEDEEMPTYDVCKLILHKISECEGNDG